MKPIFSFRYLSYWLTMLLVLPYLSVHATSSMQTCVHNLTTNSLKMHFIQRIETIAPTSQFCEVIMQGEKIEIYDKDIIICNLIAPVNVEVVFSKQAGKKVCQPTIADKNKVTPQPQKEEKQAVTEVAAEIAEEEIMDMEAAPAAPPPSPTFARKALRADMSVGLVANYTMATMDEIRQPSTEVDRENYQEFDDNPIKRVKENPVSTFSIDVDTGAYSNVRRMLNGGYLPRQDAVRVEELINYFSYDYPTPKNTTPPFNVITEIAKTPWNKDTLLLHIGIKGYDIPKAKLPPSNLVFLVDVSGSMDSPDKLGLLKSSLKLLTKQLTEKDKVSLVVYAGASGVVLEPTSGNETAKITTALEGLSAGGSTHGSAGIQLAYRMAEQAFIKDGINRVLLATDGDFNVGTVNFDALIDLIEEKRKTGISLTTLGFGTGNYNDKLMEQLADAGNGNYAYIDTLNEAQKVLVDEVSSTLQTIAKDVKIQIEFNPQNVAEYRLIGYENRMLKREDFSNDKVDAGEIGAGHTVTALYEIALVDSAGQRIETLRYGDEKQEEVAPHTDELAFLRLRYKAPDEDKSQLLEWAIKQQAIIQDLAKTTDSYRFSAAVAAFGQTLRGGKYTGTFSYDDILDLARNARGQDNFGYRGEFLQLINLAKSLSH